MTPLPTGFYPFWFWNDRITDDEIQWQVAQMAGQGIQGFFIHSRQGLKDPPYLSDAFLDRVATAVAAAEKHGLVVHLYDEYPYPSGIAGGLVTMGQPQFQATELVQSSTDVAGGPLRLDLPAGKLLSLLACPLKDGQVNWNRSIDLGSAVGVVLEEDSYQETGLTRYNQKRYFSGKPHLVLQTRLPGGNWRVYSAIQQVIEHNKYWGNFSDVLNPAAVRQFIGDTHERYYRRLGEKFGSTIRWIFTDEVIPGWSASLPEAFQKEYGYDLLPLLPALKEPAHPRHLQVSHDLHQLKYRLFCQAFEEPVSGWCQAHGLAYAAEKPSLRFAQLRYQDIPGCEPGHTKVGVKTDLLQAALRGNARATASAAYFYGKDGALDECYHSLGWSATLEDIRWMADAQLLLGIRYMVPHGFFYSTHNLRKHDAPPTLFFQAPYWPLFNTLSKRVERIAQAFEDTYMDAHLVVVDPTNGLPTAQDKANYERLLHGLMGRHLDFQVVDTDILAAGTLAAGQVQLRDLRVHTVLLPPLQWLEPALQEWLEQFTSAGGTVVRCPAPFDLDGVLAQLEKTVQPSLSLRSAGQENEAVWCVQRAGPGKTVWMVLNQSGSDQPLELLAGQPLRELPLDAGLSPRLEFENGQYLRELAPFEACLFEAAPEPELTPDLPEIVIAVPDAQTVVPRQANLVRLGDWQMSLLDKDGSVLQTSFVPAVPLANQLELGKFRLAPRIQRTFGTPPEMAWPELRVRYTCAFRSEVAEDVELVMEPGSIGGDWTLRVNGSVPLTAEDFKPSQAHVRGSLGVKITPRLNLGANTLEVEVVTADPAGGLLNPLYLAGNFGVALNPLRLVQRPEDGYFEDYSANRLPFFAGELEYRCKVELDAVPKASRLRVNLDFPVAFHEACSVSLNGATWQPLPWGPYQLELEAKHLKPGSNDLRIRVFTTLIRSFEGQTFDYAQHKYVQIA
jgi:hypothetical protein